MASSSSTGNKKRKGNEPETVFSFPTGSVSSKDIKRQKKDEEAAALAKLGNVDIQSLMECKGPVVSCVLLKADGSIEALDVDMTPSLGKCQEVLGGELTFLGQWEDLQVILLISKEQTSKSGLEKNKHKLQPPFHDAIVYGDILLTRSDDDGEAAHFGLDEYETFKATKITEWEPTKDDSQNSDDSEDDDEEEEEEDDEEDSGDEEVEEMDEEEALAMIMPALINAFKEEYGRDPNESEIADLKEKVLMGDDDEEEDDDDDDASDDMEDMELEAFMEQITPKIIANFVEQRGREPTEEELDELKAAVVAKVIDDEDVEGEDEDCDDDQN